MIVNEDTGDHWDWHDCEECDGVVIERWFKRRGKPINTEDDPDDVLDVPKNVFDVMIEEMREAKGRAE